MTTQQTEMSTSTYISIYCTLQCILHGGHNPAQRSHHKNDNSPCQSKSHAEIWLRDCIPGGASNRDQASGRSVHQDSGRVTRVTRVRERERERYTVEREGERERQA